MNHFLEEVRKKLISAVTLFRNLWEKLTGKEKAVVTGAIIAHGACFFFGGIALQAAIFSLTSLFTLAILIGYFPKAVAWCIRHMAIADLIATGIVVYWGILSGIATVALSMTLLGFAVSACLRIFRPMEEELRQMPSQVNLQIPDKWKFWKKPQVIDVEVKEVTPCFAN